MLYVQEQSKLAAVMVLLEYLTDTAVAPLQRQFVELSEPYCSDVRLCQFVTAHSELRMVLFLAPSICGFLFLYEISREPLNGFALNSHGRRVWFLAWTSLKVQVTRHKNDIFQPFQCPASSLYLVKRV